MLTVGLTGGMASGKSTVLGLFKRLGAQTDDADLWIRRLMLPGKTTHRKLVQSFGRSILDAKRHIRRAALRKLAVQCPQALSGLEAILHPELYRQIERKKKAARTRKGVWVIEIPLLFETGFDRLMDLTVCVVGRNAALARKSTSGADSALMRRLERRQWSESRKAARADHVIVNRGSIQALQREVKALYDVMISR